MRPRLAGLNPYLLEMANIREQCSWVHDDPAAATEKAEGLVRAAVLRVAHHEPLERLSVDMCPNTLVIGGGIAGMTAALELADAGKLVYLVERQPGLGGNVARVDLTAPYLDSARDMLTDRLTRVVEHPDIDVMLSSELKRLDGFVGNFKATLVLHRDGGPDEERQVDVGSVIVCTGYQEFDASRVDPSRLRQAAQRHHVLRVRAACCALGRIETKEGRLPQYVADHPLRREAAARSSTATAPASAA